MCVYLYVCMFVYFQISGDGILSQGGGGGASLSEGHAFSSGRRAGSLLHAYFLYSLYNLRLSTKYLYKGNI